MQKLNNKGFALAEILVVTVFVMIIFSIIYTNFYPIMAEYERRESYDDVDGKYAAYWFKKLIEDDPILRTNIKTLLDSGSEKYYRFFCSYLSDSPDKTLCSNLVEEYGVVKDASDNLQIYITKSNLTDFKNYVKTNSTSFSSGLNEYITYLPTFTASSGYRIILEFHRKKDENDYYAYATMEVNL